MKFASSVMITMQKTIIFVYLRLCLGLLHKLIKDNKFNNMSFVEFLYINMFLQRYLLLADFEALF